MSLLLPIHASIKAKLAYFRDIHKIPNLIFHGPSESGKRTLVHEFVADIYNHDRAKIKAFVMYVHCSHGKGIKFIREDLKFFAKTHIDANGPNSFKSIVLLNADKLTVDAQSALRRCIELFSHNTRFFIVAEDKYSLMKPILSRFCEIYVPEPHLHGRQIQLHAHNLNETFQTRDMKARRLDQLRRQVAEKWAPPAETETTAMSLMDTCVRLYEKGFAAVDLVALLDNPLAFGGDAHLSPTRRVELALCFNRVRREFRNEKLLLLFVMHFVAFDTECSLENISFV